MSKTVKIVLIVSAIVVVLAAVTGVSLYYELPRGTEEFFTDSSIRQIRLIDRASEPQIVILDDYYLSYFRSDLERLTYKPLVGKKESDPDRVIEIVDGEGKTVIARRMIARYDRSGVLVKTLEVRVSGSLDRLFDYFKAD